MLMFLQFKKIYLTLIFLSFASCSGGSGPTQSSNNSSSNDSDNNNSGTVLALINSEGNCLGFGRIRRCLLVNGKGWRIGPLIADNPKLASILLNSLLVRHSGSILIDSPGLNPYANKLLSDIGFKEVSHTVRMYKGDQPSASMDEVYGLACLELG